MTIPCPDCRGSRYGRQAGEVKLVNKAGQAASLPELMDMDVTAALDFCQDRKTVRQKLETLKQLGLGYLTLGEETPSLSGGEAQRLKLASEIGGARRTRCSSLTSRPSACTPWMSRCCWGCSRPCWTTGPPSSSSSTTWTSSATRILFWTWGPGGGEQGGRIVASGTPEEVQADPDSITGRYL